METTKKLSWLVGILAIMNLVLVGFLAWPHLRGFGPPGPPDGNLNREADRFMERQIGLSPDQMSQFEKARANTKAEFDLLRERVRDTRKRLTMSIFEVPADSASAGLLLDDLASLTRRMEAVTHQHLMGIRDFCNEEQKVRLKTFMDEVFQQSGRRPPPPPRRNP